MCDAVVALSRSLKTISTSKVWAVVLTMTVASPVPVEPVGGELESLLRVAVTVEGEDNARMVRLCAGVREAVLAKIGLVVGDVRVAVLEHLYRGDNWEITEKSTGYTKQDSHTLEFPLEVPAKGDATLTYAVHYTW